jgi:hypothetical protein
MIANQRGVSANHVLYAAQSVYHLGILAWHFRSMHAACRTLSRGVAMLLHAVATTICCNSLICYEDRRPFPVPVW